MTSRKRPTTGDDDNNLETYRIFCLDTSVSSKENLMAQKQLRRIICQLQTTIDPEECIGRVCYTCQDNLIILIATGHVGSIMVQEIQKLQQSSSIFMYCFNKEVTERCKQPLNKVKAIYSKIDELINVVRMDQKHRSRVEESLGIEILDQTSADLKGQFLHSQMLVDTLIQMKPNKHDKHNFIELCKNEYKNSRSALNLIKEFDVEYRPVKAIWWYMRDSFVYHMLNKALSVQNVDVLFPFHTIIKDIFEQLRVHQCKERIQVYRGQMLSRFDLKKLRKSTGKFISIKSFLLTTLDRRIALRLIKCSIRPTTSDDLVPVLFEIDADPHIIQTMIDNNRPFAKISKLNDNGDEREVMFMVSSTFKLIEIVDSDSLARDKIIPIIRMTWCSNYENDYKQLYDHIKNEYEREETNLLSLGQLVYRMGKFDLAEKYYCQSLREFPSNDICRSAIYHNLGMATNSKGEYDTSLEWYSKSIGLLVTSRPSDHVRIGITYNSMGNVYRNKGDRILALELYNRAISLFKHADDQNHPYVASFYNNIGIIYYEEKKYLQALDFYEKSLNIKKKHLAADHPFLSGSYDNIGIVHRYLGQYDFALKYYNRSLEIRLKSLPDQHPDIAMTYMNIAVVYGEKDDFEQALVLFHKALKIYKVSLTFSHPDVINLKDAIRRLENKMKRTETI
ncbi:unnamed protein product [Rotaria magnacalcarata]|uniref:Uncharacterized protein n=1 Tax=Rotaria magnacalcarata TaxID=392030 RepID=A0A815T7K7_9BILA|nr:unnamed protein product [Rotaria magnacalcarata]CAF1498314.1 unnamed protein product [Rotaria magnacalcarata]CAF2086834.1 unnamed protein product [Rotaria magnacalcarata]CAF3988539.1 unnamed protein product [Rotaria magnacalcarata]CAF4006604.1 unnamed protein product [Rotaria magnacalcarata]